MGSRHTGHTGWLAVSAVPPAAAAAACRSPLDPLRAPKEAAGGRASAAELGRGSAGGAGGRVRHHAAKQLVWKQWKHDMSLKKGSELGPPCRSVANSSGGHATSVSLGEETIAGRLIYPRSRSGALNTIVCSTLRSTMM